MSARRWFTRTLAALFALSALAAPSAARAQNPPLALDRFTPAPVGDRFYGAPSPDVFGHLRIQGGVVFDYAHAPLVLRVEGEGTGAGTVVGDQLFMHLDASIAVWSRLAFDLSLPFALLQTGDSPIANGVSYTSPGSAEVGDLRFGLRGRIFGDHEDPLQLSAALYLWAPTGRSDPGSFVGNGNARGKPMLIAGGRTRRFVWAFSVGPEIGGSQIYGEAAQGTRLDFGGGIGLLLLRGKLQVGPELSISVVLDNRNGTPPERSTNAELLLDARYRFLDTRIPILRHFEAGIGIGPGLTHGLGTPDVRFVAMAGYTPAPEPPGPKPEPPGPQPEPPRPPVLDQDGDGLRDSEDACPSIPGVASKDPKKNGCPAPTDGDGDGILDGADACPTVPGDPSDDPKLHGCPAPKDTDDDLVPDDLDACPTVPGVPNGDPKKNGCPKTTTIPDDTGAKK